MAMLEGVAELTLERLNAITQAWVELEYHQHLHSEIGTTPLKRFLDAPVLGATARTLRRCAGPFAAPPRAGNAAVTVPQP